MGAPNEAAPAQEAANEPRLGGMTPRKRLSVALDCLLWLDEYLPGLLPPDSPAWEHLRELRREVERLMEGGTGQAESAKAGDDADATR